jgi:hypothetical protein
MLAQPDQPLAEIDRDTLTPLCDEAEFAQEIAELVADEAPRLFAVVQEYGERADGWVEAWGMAFENCVKVVGVDRRLCRNLPSAEHAARMFSRGPHITARLVWVNPDPSGRGALSFPNSTGELFEPGQDNAPVEFGRLSASRPGAPDQGWAVVGAPWQRLYFLPEPHGQGALRAGSPARLLASRPRLPRLRTSVPPSSAGPV